MQLRWEPKFGPAFVTGIIQIIAMLVTGTVVYANLQNDVKEVTRSNARLEKLTTINSDAIIAQSTRITKLETSIEFIVPSLKRIEGTLDAMSRK